MTILDSTAEQQAALPAQGDTAPEQNPATGKTHRGNGQPASNAFLDRFFHITERGSTLAREVRGGLVTFFTMAYIVILNPLILGGFSADNAPTDVAGGWLSAAQVGAVTGLTAGVMTIAVRPDRQSAVRPGRGTGHQLLPRGGRDPRSHLARGHGPGGHQRHPDRPVRRHRRADRDLPGRAQGTEGRHHRGHRPVHRVHRLRGLGLRPAATTGGPPVQLGDNGSITSIPTMVFIVGLLVMGILVARKVQGGLLIGIVATTVLAAVVEAILHIGPASKPTPAAGT